ncbi:DNA damage-induced apoptosis suppressor protein [Chelmon rostratus]|uniref:DNA damage-induced apoptosis suppressor protein n=1 Tax=Chelmon rostratus TaxID=109905 RepID=UPI001BE50DE0|nr:DNA damage-induced apoptosis suppressor protein [Chelmon rostratus]
MSVRRAVVDCAVLSQQDACVFYPCCAGCFSRTDVDQQDTTRCRCPKCGYSCLREQVDYRYRLSLRVTRDGCIFGVTVFGTCLNPFFGIHASGLQRLVENSDEPVGASTRSMLLRKAVEDCFIGRHFIFGIKVTGTENWPWLGGSVVNGSSSKDMVQFIASQMFLPKAAGLEGCTVVSYYHTLLQKAAECELGSTDPHKPSKPPATTPLLLIPHYSPASSFNNGTLCASGLLLQSLQRSPYQDCSLSPTPPWQQSLGLVTSSAEQEEGCSTQDNGDENSRHTDNIRTPHHAQRGSEEDHKVTEETVPQPPLSLECSSYNHPSFAQYPHSSIEKAVGNTTILNTWFSPSPPGYNSSKVKGFSVRQPAETFLPSSLAWEDLPLSESLTEFLCEGNKHFDTVRGADPSVNVQNQKEARRNNLEIRSHEKKLLTESTSVCNTQITDSHSCILLDLTNTPAPNGGDRHDLSDRIPAGCENKSQATNICSHGRNQEDEKVSCFENEDEEQLEGNTYNCSADLFSSSLMIDMNTDTLSMHAETVRTSTEARPQLSKTDKWHLSSETVHVPSSTPDKQKLKSHKCINRDSLIPQDLDFIPPSQSTPIVKVVVLSGSPASSYRISGEFSSQADSQDSCAFYRNLPEVDSTNPAKTLSSLLKLNCVGGNQMSRCGRESTKENLLWSTTSSRHSQRSTPKRRFRKPDRQKSHLLAQQLPRVQKGSLNTGSTGRINHKCDSSDCDVTVCDYEDGEAVIVPPTPAARTRQSVKLRRRKQTENSRSDLGCIWENEIHCKRTLLAQPLTSSQRGLACDSETVDEASLGGSDRCLLDNENKACDWSRDLFSDSF